MEAVGAGWGAGFSKWLIFMPAVDYAFLAVVLIEANGRPQTSIPDIGSDELLGAPERKSVGPLGATPSLFWAKGWVQAGNRSGVSLRQFCLTTMGVA